MASLDGRFEKGGAASLRAPRVGVAHRSACHAIVFRGTPRM